MADYYRALLSRTVHPSINNGSSGPMELLDHEYQAEEQFNIYVEFNAPFGGCGSCSPPTSLLFDIVADASDLLSYVDVISNSSSLVGAPFESTVNVSFERV